MIRIEDIIEIRKAVVYDRGYEIVFPNNKIIWLTKRRTIAGLLLLIKYESCSEEDLVGANNRLREIKQILQGKYNESWIKDRYGDANKPFSELWTEEGFSCVHAEGYKVTDNMCFVKKIMIRYLILMPKPYENRLAHLINELYLTVKIIIAIYVVHY